MQSSNVVETFVLNSGYSPVLLISILSYVFPKDDIVYCSFSLQGRFRR